MSEYAIRQDAHPGSRPLFIVLALFTFGMLAAIILSAHAVEKHGEMAVIVRQCMQKSGPLETWDNPTTGRQASVCQVGDRFGIQIVENGREITSFIKEKLKSLEQVRRYLENSGYFPGKD